MPALALELCDLFERTIFRMAASKFRNSALILQKKSREFRFELRRHARRGYASDSSQKALSRERIKWRNAGATKRPPASLEAAAIQGRSHGALGGQSGRDHGCRGTDRPRLGTAVRGKGAALFLADVDESGLAERRRGSRASPA